MVFQKCDLLKLAAVIFCVICFSCKDNSIKPPDNTHSVGYQYDIIWTGLHSSSWPMHLCDPQATGRTKTKIIPGSLITEIFSQTFTCYSAPVIGDSNTFYFSSPKSVYRFSSAGAQLWAKDLSAYKNYCTPLVTANGNVVVTNLIDKITCYNGNGSSAWEYLPGAQQPEQNTLQIDPAGNIYFITVSGVLHKLSPQGALLRRDSIPNLDLIDVNRFTFDPTGTVLYMISFKKITAFNLSTHTVAWTYNSTHTPQTVMVDAQGNLYFLENISATNTVRFISLNQQGTARFSMDLSVKNAAYYYQNSPTIDKNGTIYIGLDTLYAINYDGSIKWKSVLSGYCIMPVICDIYNTLVVAVKLSGKLVFYFLDNAGALIKQAEMAQGTPVNSPFVFADGRVGFVVNNALYRIE
jgi:outer membrane protein assembly factor BamB